MQGPERIAHYELLPLGNVTQLIWYLKILRQVIDKKEACCLPPERCSITHIFDDSLKIKRV